MLESPIEQTVASLSGDAIHAYRSGGTIELITKFNNVLTKKLGGA
jgi:hypothetical protein